MTISESFVCFVVVGFFLRCSRATAYMMEKR